MSTEALKIAKRIINLAERIEAGTPGILGTIDFAEYDLGNCLFLLRAHNHNTEFATPYSRPSAVQINAFAVALGADAPKLDKVFEAFHESVAPFVMNYTWGRMKENVDHPDAADYKSFHDSRKTLNLEPYSQELFDTLGTTSKDYAPIDRAYAFEMLKDIIDVGAAIEMKHLVDQLKIGTTSSKRAAAFDDVRPVVSSSFATASSKTNEPDEIEIALDDIKRRQKDVISMSRLAPHHVDEFIERYCSQQLDGSPTGFPPKLAPK